MMKYDSRANTEVHIETVRDYLRIVIGGLNDRWLVHDRSKLESPEREIFDEYTPKLKGTTYGSDEYKQYLKEMKVGLDHHYKENSHHPEHFSEGVNGMNLMDVIEMICDWLAAVKRHDDGDIMKSIEINRKRFGMTDQLVEIIKNTVKEIDIL